MSPGTERGQLPSFLNSFKMLKMSFTTPSAKLAPVGLKRSSWEELESCPGLGSRVPLAWASLRLWERLEGMRTGMG